MVAKQISQWIKFEVSKSAPQPDTAIFAALKKAAGYIAGYQGPVQEERLHYMIAIAWESQQAHDAFTASPEYSKLLADLKTHSGSGNDPVTFTVDFKNVIFWPVLGPNTELHTVYFPANFSGASKEEVGNLNGLTMPHGLGIGGNLAHLSPYRKVPVCGWTEETTNFKGQDATSCVWLNSWANKQKEREFKEEKRLSPRDGEDTGPLILEAFETELTDRGALGWDKIHVDFKML